MSVDGKNFFQRMPVRFEDVVIDEEGGIPSGVFVDACREFIKVFGKFI